MHIYRHMYVCMHIFIDARTHADAGARCAYQTPVYWLYQYKSTNVDANTPAICLHICINADGGVRCALAKAWSKCSSLISECST